MFTASIFYFDTTYSQKTSRRVLGVLEKYDMFPPKKIYADKLTNNRYMLSDENTRDLFVNAYAATDVFQIGMSNGDGISDSEFWKVDWQFTFLKRSNRDHTSTFKPWNILSIKTTHGRMTDVKAYKAYLQCVNELIDIIHPFYASIEDQGNWVQLMHNKHRFTPGKVRELFWGNYWGYDYCNKFGMEQILNIPSDNIYKVSDGVFFTLTDHITSCYSRKANKKRKEIKRYLKAHKIPIGTGLRERLTWFRGTG